MSFRKKIIILAILGAALYFSVGYHFILIGSKVKMLKKSSPTLNYTFFNAKGKTNRSILSIDELREDGIGDLLVEMGMMSEEEREILMERYDR
jgi:hypothetical protein